MEKKLIPGKLLVQFDPYDMGFEIDNSYDEERFIGITGTVIGKGDILSPTYVTEHTETPYNINVGVNIGDRVLMRWVKVSGVILDKDNTGTIDYSGVIAVIKENDEGDIEYFCRNNYAIVSTSGKVIATSKESTLEDNMPDIGQYVLAKYDFKVEYIGNFDDIRFLEIDDIMVISDKELETEFLLG